MIEESEARKKILDATSPGAVVICSLKDALGRYSAVDIFAGVDLPGFDNSEMDGYALRAEDAVSVGARLRVTGEQAAGVARGLQVGKGEAVRIFTGAPIPQGADAVIMQEDVRVIEEDGVSCIEVVEAVGGPGEFIRLQGSDVCVGQKVIHSGEKITPGRVGLLASQGLGELEVYQSPRVTVVTTGDELAGMGEELAEGQIYNSNAPMLAALVKQFVDCEVNLLHARDESSVLSGALQEALDDSDVVIIAGGVSVGDRDLVKETLASLGVETDFWRVRIKPGKPFLFGQRGETLVFGLPGNPVSAYTTFLLFVAGSLCRKAGGCWEGKNVLPLPRARCRLAERIDYSHGHRPHYMRGVVREEDMSFTPMGLQASHAIFGLSRSDALLRVEEGTVMEEGAEVSVYRL